MLKKDVGVNAGVIWKLLSDKGTLSMREIGESTGYPEKLIYLALGWLSRENKVRFLIQNDVLYFDLNSSTSEIYY